MRPNIWLTLLAPAIVSLPTSAMAQGAGPWRVAGDINGKSFVVQCLFDEKGQHLGGACVDVTSPDKAGKRHELIDGSIRGADVTWSYAVKVMMMSVEIKFTGQINGSRMIGTVSAKGRQGTFSAVKL